MEYSTSLIFIKPFNKEAQWLNRIFVLHVFMGECVCVFVCVCVCVCVLESKLGMSFMLSLIFL